MEQVTQLPGCDGGVVVPGGARRSASEGAVRELRPGSSAQMIGYGQGRDRDVVVCAPAVGVRQDPLR
ncbi:hypothetical protein BFF78_15460 [Streptomyces fodineus]|uniref:Uncharacterized protein n=1 Tax=Streptomyces fodineus TaxID=1904616 RepID=A0A1D7Y9H3_9ACTN|nr:hypothetical protein BFF78_15460 [Streptomyces fodineus]